MTPKQARRLYEKVGSIRKLARQLGCGEPQLRRLVLAGGGTVQRWPAAKLTLPEMVELYRSGQSVTKVAAAAGRSHVQVGELLRRAGVKMRRGGPPKGRARLHGYTVRAQALGLTYNRYVRLGAVMKLGGKCARCGITDLRVLDLNHVNGVGRSRKGRGWGRDPELLGHCLRILAGEAVPFLEVRCVNCNRIHEYERGNRSEIPEAFYKEPF